MKLLSHLWTARGLVIFGFLAAAVPVGATFVHVGDEAARMVDGSTHSWHHFFREGFGDLGAMAAILVILFAAPRYRHDVVGHADSDVRVLRPVLDRRAVHG